MPPAGATFQWSINADPVLHTSQVVIILDRVRDVSRTAHPTDAFLTVPLGRRSAFIAPVRDTNASMNVRVTIVKWARLGNKTFDAWTLTLRTSSSMSIRPVQRKLQNGRPEARKPVHVVEPRATTAPEMEKMALSRVRSVFAKKIPYPSARGSNLTVR